MPWCRARSCRPTSTRLPDQPDLVPYRTAYDAQQWGFCVSHRVWEAMRDPHYRVRIDSTLAPGSLSYGELAIAGREKSEVLISVHCCHPSLANDNLSGIAVATELARHLLRPRQSPELSLPVHSRHHRLADLAGAARECPGAHRARPGAELRRRCRRRSTTSKAVAAMPPSTVSWPMCLRARAAPRHHALLPLRLRRTAVLLARLRPARRLLHAVAQRHLSGSTTRRRQSWTSSRRRLWNRASMS